MKKLFILMAFISTNALADQAMLQKNACLSCHAADKKLVGPAFKDIANKYNGQKTAVDMLAKKIRSGGSGVWGSVPMPANSHVSENDAKKLATYVLSIK